MQKNTEMTLAGLCLASAQKYGRRTAFEIFRQNKLCALTSYRLLGIRARQFASLMVRLGVRRGDSVLILAENRPQWPEALFGAALAGAVSVPLAEISFPALLRRAAEKDRLAAVCASRQYLPALAGMDSSVPVILIDSVSDTDIEVSLDGTIKTLPLSRPEAAGDFPAVSPDDTAVIFYDSAAGENPQCTRLSGRDMILRASAARTKIFPRDRLLSTIPLSHAFECTRGLLRAVAAGATTIYLDDTPSPRTVIAAAQALKPTIMLALPQLAGEFRGDFIEPLLRADILYRYALTRPLAYRRAGKKLLSALGKILRCLEIEGDIPEETENFLRQIRFPCQIVK